jgi:hypothetical protein
VLRLAGAVEGLDDDHAAAAARTWTLQHAGLVERCFGHLGVLWGETARRAACARARCLRLGHQASGRTQQRRALNTTARAASCHAQGRDRASRNRRLPDRSDGGRLRSLAANRDRMGGRAIASGDPHLQIVANERPAPLGAGPKFRRTRSFNMEMSNTVLAPPRIAPPPR